MDVASALRYCWLAWLVAVILNCLSLAVILTFGLMFGAMERGGGEVEWGWYAGVSVLYAVAITAGAVMHWRMLKSHWRKGRGVRPEGYLKARLWLWSGFTTSALLVVAVSLFRGAFFVYFLLAMLPAAIVLWTWPTAQLIRETADTVDEEAGVEEDELFHIQKKSPRNQPV